MPYVIKHSGANKGTVSLAGKATCGSSRVATNAKTSHRRKLNTHELAPFWALLIGF